MEQIVNITKDAVTYSPDPPVIKLSDTVRFVMDDRLDAVTVEFTDGTPFAQTNFGLNGSISALANKTETVISVSEAVYRFDVVPVTREPPGTLSGELEVSTDPPEDEK